MSTSHVPHIFDSFTKILAAPVNENFQFIQDEISNTVNLPVVDTIAALRAFTTIPASKTITVLGYTTNNDGGQGTFIRMPSDTTSADNGGTIIVDVYGSRWYRIYEDLTPEMFGCVGNGIVDDKIPFTRFLQASTNNNCKLTKTYEIKSLIGPIALTNCRFYSVNGATIQGAFGYTIIQFADLNNVIIDGITFKNNYNQPVWNGRTGTLQLYQNNVNNVKIINCTFTNPLTNGNALAFYINITSIDNAHSCKNLIIEYNNFINLGSIATVIMNRFTGTNASSYMDGISFSYNTSNGTGILNSIGGQVVSFDGCGQNFKCDYNNITGAQVIGIENVAFNRGSISFNKFYPSTTTYNPIAIDATGNLNDCSDLVVEGNCVYAQTANDHISFSYCIGNVHNCKFSNNYWRAYTHGGYGALLVRGASFCTFSSDFYESNDISALFVEGGTNNCIWDELCKADSSINDLGTTQAVVRFSATNVVSQATTSNLWYGTIVRGSTGNFIDQSLGGNTTTGNVWNFTQTDVIGLLSETLTVAMPDSNYTLVGQQSGHDANTLIIQGTLTASRNLTVEAGTFRRGPKLVWNQTNHSINIKTVTGSGNTLTTNTKYMATYDIGSDTFPSGVLT